MPYNNEFYIAAAGAGKTSCIVKYALEHTGEKVLLTTYTRENTSILFSYLRDQNGFVPNNTTIYSWYTFLLTECVRPYQSFLYPNHRVDGIQFVNQKSAIGVSRTKPRLYYFNNNAEIYSDKLSEFAYFSNVACDGKLIERLEKLYDVIMIDEAQDLSGWDFDFIKLLLESSIKVIVYGDPRQKTYSTTPSSKNPDFSKDIHVWLKSLQSLGLGSITHMNYSNRCIQAICDFADSLFPDFPHTESRNIVGQSHMGIFLVNLVDLTAYYEEFSPQILVHDIRSGRRFPDFSSRNFGDVKGQTYDRVLIIPTKPILDFLKNGECSASSVNKLYVAITRARLSVAFLADCSCVHDCIKRWHPSQN